MNGTSADLRRLNPRQYRALVRVLLQETFRPGVDASTKARVHPLFQLLFALGTLGLFFSFNARDGDAFSFIHFLGLSAALLTALVIVPEGLDAYQRRREVLGTKPIGPRTGNAARVTTLAGMAVFITFCFTAMPLVICLAYLDRSWAEVLALALLLFVGSFSAACLWHALTMVVASRWGIDRVRSTANLMIVLVALTIAGISLSRLGDLLTTPRFPDLLATWLPSSWFVGLVVGPRHPVGVIGALAIVAVAVFVLLRLDVDAVYGRAAEAKALPGHRVALWWLDRLRAIAGRQRPPAVLGGRWLPAPTYAAAALMLRASGREELSRLKGLLPLLLVVLVSGGVLVMGVTTPGVLFAVTMGLFAVSDGLNAVSHSGDASASWVLWAAPLPPRRVVAAIRWAAMLRSAALPAVLVTVLLVLGFDGAEALLPALCFPLLADSLVVLVLLIRPRMPLASEATAAPGFVRMIAVQLAIVPAVIFFAIVQVLTGFGLLGCVVAVVLLAGGLVVDLVLAYLAGERLRRLECLV